MTTMLSKKKTMFIKNFLVGFLVLSTSDIDIILDIPDFQWQN